MTLSDATLVAAMALAVYVPKALPLLLLGDRRLPESVERWLGYVAPAVLGALVGPAIVGSFADGGIGFSEAAFIATALVAWRTQNVLAAAGAGMVLVVLGSIVG